MPRYAAYSPLEQLTALCNYGGMNIRIARIYGDAQPSGYRILVDRLWPRGVSKERADLDEWAKDIAPSAELRTWFGHKPERFAEFSRHYEAELHANPALSEFIGTLKRHANVVLLYGAKDPQVNHAAVLQKYLSRAPG